ncbi:MAG TPA: RNA polymerase sigma factor, partial [Steroidobacteraceae bacterium]|nr:RNA polymerase sigma factor [Steroidobacteraceae bacterium]
ESVDNLSLSETGAALPHRRAALQLSPVSGVLGLNEHTPVRHPPTGPDQSTEFTNFMRAYQDMVFSTAARLAGNDRQAEDIAQEVFLRAYENFAHLRTSPTAGGWLKTVTTNLTLNHLSRYRRRWRLFSELRPAADEDSPGPELGEQPDTLLADLGAEQRRVLIDGALRKLPEHQRLALVLYHFEDLSYEEIAVKLGASLAKIKTDMRRARAALLPVLQSSGIAAGTLED